MDSRFGRLLNWVVLVGGIAAILWPAFIDEHKSLTQILISLFEFERTLNFAMRWLAVILVIGALYILITNRVYRNIPISVIWTKLHVFFDEGDGSRVRVEREQALRANQTNVTAIFITARPGTPEGRVVRRAITGTVYCANDQFPSRIQTHGTEQKGFEIIQMFGRPLPYSWYLPLFPMWYLNREPEKLWGFLRRMVPIRRLTILYENEFNVPEPSMSFMAAIYPQFNVEIVLHCKPNHDLKNIQVLRIKNNGVVEVSFRSTGAGVHSMYLDRMQNETVRITWEGPTKGADGKAAHQSSDDAA
jgi:hypothetical protein